jgi:phosphatidylserine/phosphatidylglycerophosphate/cardiolipin synthase-like enzyme
LDLLKMIRRAEKTIVIENSYVVLPQVFKVELARAISRGVRVILLTNSPQTNNLFWPRIAYEADAPELVRMGIELWEFKGPGVLHAKAMVVDGRRSYLGSFNLDPRSLRLNTETGFIADDGGFARDLLGQIRATQVNSTLVAFQGRWVVPRSRVPVLSRLWGWARRLLLALMREQV